MKNFVKLHSLCLVILIIILHSCKKDDLPTLTTTTITNISATSASSGGYITSDGGIGVTGRGICWGVNANPATSDSKTNDGDGIGQFVSNLSGLTAGSTYHVRAYAINSVGTAYGADLSFATLGEAPSCLTQPATNISATGVTLNGTVNSNYLPTTVTFEYGPTTSYGQTVTATQSPVSGNSNTNVTAEITGLAEGTTYHFRVKTVNSLGTTYGNDIVFITLGQAPTAITQSACCLSATGAKLNGTVNANYVSTTVTFEYGTTSAYGSSITAIQSPVTGNNSTSVSASISGLNAGTTYHFRVKAVNSLGTAFGDDFSFTANPIFLATITTTLPSSITETTAISGGKITDDSGGTITERGVCWGTSANPTISGEHTTDGSGTGSFTSNMKCLSFATTYYVRAYATNSAGTAYGDQLSFLTPGVNPIIFNPNLTYGSVSDIDGNCYKTIQIGDQIWIAENLKTTRLNDNTMMLNDTDWSTFTTQTYCWYNNDIANKNPYGALYNWYAVATGKLCPSGWHVPDNGEWADLEEFLGGNVVAGGKLKETGTTHWTIPNTGATNETGFTALPGGFRDGKVGNSLFYRIGDFGNFWSSGLIPHLHFSGADMFYLPAAAVYDYPGFYVRCLKD
jgi:uncharacterized protein (TIGR02145 family)